MIKTIKLIISDYLRKPSVIYSYIYHVNKVVWWVEMNMMGLEIDK